MEFEIRLNKLRFYAYHGVMEEESRIGNEFIVNLMVKIPYNEKVKDDTLESTISYSDLYDIISKEMGSRRQLLEKVALEIALKIKNTYPQIISGNVSIEKVRPPIEGMLGSASVSLTF